MARYNRKLYKQRHGKREQKSIKKLKLTANKTRRKFRNHENGELVYEFFKNCFKIADLRNAILSRKFSYLVDENAPTTSQHAALRRRMKLLLESLIENYAAINENGMQCEQNECMDENLIDVSPQTVAAIPQSYIHSNEDVGNFGSVINSSNAETTAQNDIRMSTCDNQQNNDTDDTDDTEFCINKLKNFSFQ